MELRTIVGEVEFSQKIKRSEFICHAGYVKSVREAVEFVKKTVNDFRDATHNCWAYRVMEGGKLQENCSDAGEPSGTAGKPILMSLRKLKLANVAVVITRYFGGVKLGKRGLMDAYSSTTYQGLKKATIVQLGLFRIAECNMDYASFSRFENLLKRKGGSIIEVEFSERVHVIAAVPCDIPLCEGCQIVDEKYMPAPAGYTTDFI